MRTARIAATVILFAAISAAIAGCGTIIYKADPRAMHSGSVPRSMAPLDAPELNIFFKVLEGNRNDVPLTQRVYEVRGAAYECVLWADALKRARERTELVGNYTGSAYLSYLLEECKSLTGQQTP